jgi:hypothetical protein
MQRPRFSFFGDYFVKKARMEVTLEARPLRVIILRELYSLGLLQFLLACVSSTQSLFTIGWCRPFQRISCRLTHTFRCHTGTMKGGLCTWQRRFSKSWRPC